MTEHACTVLSGPKAQKKFKRLMLSRIKWEEHNSKRDGENVIYIYSTSQYVGHLLIQGFFFHLYYFLHCRIIVKTSRL